MNYYNTTRVQLDYLSGIKDHLIILFQLHIVKIFETRMSFAAAMSNVPVTTENNAVSHGTTYSNTLNMFFKFVRRVDEKYVEDTFRDAYKEERLTALKVLFHRRDCRGGVGERSIFRVALVTLFKIDPETVFLNLGHIPNFGRWDDVFVLMPFCEHEVLKLVSEQLKADLVAMKDTKPVSLCAKWVPSEKGKLDVKYSIYSKLAGYMQISPRSLRKVYLVPLRHYLKVVETLLTAKQFDKINFQEVPSQAMIKLKKAFAKKCPHWEAYVAKLAEGKVKVNAKLVDPHQLVDDYIKGKPLDVVTEAQWKVKEQEILEMGGLGKSVALVDVSGSMFGDNAIKVAVALGLLISKSTSEPFRNCVMTFDTNPSFIQLQASESLFSSVKELLAIPWGGSTNFNACFEVLLERANNFQYPANHSKHPKVKGLVPEDMPDKIICISDMQFNQAGQMTNLESVKAQYKQSKYKMPTIVFWNVRANTIDFPSTQDESNVALISGFNANILKSIIKGEIATPIEVMIDAIKDERYKVLKVAEAFELV